VQPSERIVNIGCGNSTLSADMYDAGFKTVTNVDFSQVVITEMKRKNATRPLMKWIVMDMLHTSFEDACEYSLSLSLSVFVSGILNCVFYGN